MNEVAIVIFSCDKNEELWAIFNHLLEKYWPEHPATYLLTETKNCHQIPTITKNYDLEHWTRRIRESLMEIPYDYVVFICDDCFLKEPVNKEKFKRSVELIHSENAANINYELLPSELDFETPFEGFKRKSLQSPYRLSLLCGIWNKEKLISLLSEKDCSPWILEQEQECKDYDYYQTTDEKVLSWFRDGMGENAAIRHGKWMTGIEDFLRKEGLTVDYSKRGFWSEDYWQKYAFFMREIKKLQDEIKEEKEKIAYYDTQIQKLRKAEEHNKEGVSNE